MNIKLFENFKFNSFVNLSPINKRLIVIGAVALTAISIFVLYLSINMGIRFKEKRIKQEGEQNKSNKELKKLQKKETIKPPTETKVQQKDVSSGGEQNKSNKEPKKLQEVKKISIQFSKNSDFNSLLKSIDRHDLYCAKQKLKKKKYKSFVIAWIWEVISNKSTDKIGKLYNYIKQKNYNRINQNKKNSINSGNVSKEVGLDKKYFLIAGSVFHKFKIVNSGSCHEKNKLVRKIKRFGIKEQGDLMKKI